MTITIEPPRDQWGRYKIRPAAGGKETGHVRVTTWAKTLDDEASLSRWKQRTTARGLAVRPDLLARVAAMRDDDRDGLDRVCEDALEAAQASAKANLGTALHEFCERVDLGEDVAIPAPWDADVAAYRAALDAAGLEVVAVERICVLPQALLGEPIAGTFDRGLRHRASGVTYIGDIKTGSVDYAWASIAVQLACYANAETLWDPATGAHESMLDVDKQRGIVIHLPSGEARCELHFVDIEQGWEAAQHAGWVRKWRKAAKTLHQPLGPTEAKKTRSRAKPAPEPTPEATPEPAAEVAPDPQRAAELRHRVEVLRATEGGLERLSLCWPAGVATFRQSDAHTPEELDLIDKALAQAEIATSAPFDPLPAQSADEAPAAPSAPVWRAVACDEGEPAEEACAALRAVVERLPADRRPVLGALIQEAIAAGVDFRPSMNPSQRRYALGRLAYKVALDLDGDPELVAAVLTLAWGEEPPPAPLGALVGACTIDQAERAVEHIDAVTAGRLVAHIDGDGHLTLLQTAAA